MALTIVLVVLAALAVVDLVLDFQHLPEFKIEYLDATDKFRDYSHADLDGDSILEVAKLGWNEKSVEVFDADGFTFPHKFHRTDANLIISLNTVDLDNDGRAEIILGMKDTTGDSVWITVVDWDNQVLCNTVSIKGKDITPQGDFPGWGGIIDSVIAADLDNDGRMELFAQLNTGYDKYPRGLYVYSYPDGNLKWKFLTGGAPDWTAVQDVDGDGLAEVFFGTMAPGNGAEANGISDTCGYIVSLTNDGKLRWKQQVTPWSHHAWMLLLSDSLGTADIYTLRVVGRANSGSSVPIFEKLNAVTGEVVSRCSQGLGNRTRLLPLKTSANYASLLVSDTGVIVMDRDLNKVRAVSLPGCRLYVAKDFDGDKMCEILAVKADSLFILDTLLECKAHFRCDQIRRIDRVFSFNRSLPCKTDIEPASLIYLRESHFSSSKYWFVLSRIIPGKLPWKEQIGEVLRESDWPRASNLAAICFVLGGLVFVSKRRAVDPGDTISTNPGFSHLLTTLTNFNHGQTASTNLNRLAFLIKNIPGEESMLGPFSESLSDAMQTFHQFTRRQIDDVVSAVRRSGLTTIDKKSFEESAARLVSSVLEINPQDVRSLSRHAGHYKKTLPPAVEDVRQHIKQARFDVKRQFQTDVVLETSRVLSSTASEMKEEGIVAPKVSISGDAGARAFFDASEYRTIVEELLSNARRVLKQSDRKSIEVQIELNESIVVRVIDSGPGLASGDFTRVFDRGFSTKSVGGGYGLYHAATTVAKYDGIIRVAESEPFKRTVFLLELTRIQQADS